MKFDYSYTIEYVGDFWYGLIGRLADTVACCVSEATGSDSESWDLSFHRKAMTVSFSTASSRDAFVELYEEVVGDDDRDGMFVPAAKCIRGFAPAQCP